MLCMIFINYEKLMKNTFFKKFKIFYIRESKQVFNYFTVLTKDYQETLVSDTYAPPASTCRPDLPCAQPIELHEETVYKIEPSITTKNYTVVVATMGRKGTLFCHQTHN